MSDVKLKINVRLSIEEAGYVHSILASDSHNPMSDDIRRKIQRAIYNEEDKQ